MAIPYKVVERLSKPGITGSVKKFYALAVHLERVTINELCKEISDGRTLTETDVRAVLLSLTRKIEYHLSKGHLVELGDLGTITVGLSSEGVLKEKDFSSNYIKKSKYVFRPGRDLKRAAKVHEFEKTNLTPNV